MRLDDDNASSNIEDRRGQGGFPGLGGDGQGLGGMGRGGGIGGGLIGMLLPMILSRFGIGGVIVLGILYFLFSGLGGGSGGVQAPSAAPPGQVLPGQQAAAPATPGVAPKYASGGDQFIANVLGYTEKTWGEIFAERGERYAPPTLVLFSGRVRSACGSATAASGPFYCPGDRKVYLDTSFFDELARRFGAPGDFAAAYVIAHEVGHHVQTLTGISDKVRQAQSRGSQAQGNALQVRMELQADCFAGVWASRNRQVLDAGDFAEGVRAAQAIGDDTLQRQSGGTVTPDSFTHGSSAQRVAWLTRGYESGKPEVCDTFGSQG